MFTIQYLDYEEGSAARWRELANTRRESRFLTLKLLLEIRATDDEESMCIYRVVEVDSDAYYSQPTDKLEY